VKVDLRDVKTLWINIDSSVDNAKKMEEQFDYLGFKDHERISASTTPSPRNEMTTHYGTHYIGCGESHIKCFSENGGDVPLFILEDDAKAIDDFNPIIEVPDDAGAIYVGASVGNPRTQIIDTGHSDVYRVMGMLATHAILYVGEYYIREAEKQTIDYIHRRRMPLDMGFSVIQANWNVYALKKPLFYQADERESCNKWEHYTKVGDLKPTGRMAGI
jgi:hypothetical protein